MIHYSMTDPRAAIAVCGDHNASFWTFSLSNVQSIITCPKCRDVIRARETDAEMLAMFENAWSPNPKQPVWSETRKRWVLPTGAASTGRPRGK